ncbi:MAG: polyphosphate kinase 2 family protein [Gemmatimonadetes bacterium]|nr:polyphosphate kinase 2 family protein [Gemmatimonadota bacterium]
MSIRKEKNVFESPESPWLVPFDGSFRVGAARTAPPPGVPDERTCRKRLKQANTKLEALQGRLYADNRWGFLIIFQAMDAAGKDGTIRAVFDGVDPMGCQVFSFKQPSAEELDHDFLWRTTVRLPERGRLGIFNRSYYEEVLVVRVHPEHLGPQRLPRGITPERLWQERFASIRDHEAHLARSGTVVVKFWLNVSKEEQRARFLARLDDPEKHWKFAPGDVKERAHWAAYMQAYEDALRETSRPWAPWYAIPADNKDWMRMTVAETIVAALGSLDLRYPEVPEGERARFMAIKEALEEEGG